MTHKQNILQRWLNYFKFLVVYHFSMYYVEKKHDGVCKVVKMEKNLKYLL